MDVFDLFAKISLDTSDYERQLDGAKSGLSNLGGKIKGAVGGAAKIAAAGVAAAATGAVALSKSAIEGYADYEQLTGGVETLFKDSSGAVIEYAQNAYKTAGLSANEYMETVTSFSASLLQSLGGDTEAAAHIGDLAITDMADNANKMGSSMESIQNAYQGFAKQNYTMLDNLKLGYGGTKQEMERLLADAEAFSGVHYDISSLSDVYEAIHVVQTELGITGTTALEASETISGSTAAMKSAWANLLTGLADENADFEGLVGNFTNSLVTMADNLIPRIEVAMDGIGTLLTAFADTILPKIIDYITANLPQIVETGITIVIKLVEGLMKAIPQLVAALPEIVKTIVKTIVDMSPEMWEVGKQMVEGIWQGIKNAASWFTEQVRGFFSGIVNNVKSFLGIASPSKVFRDQVGKQMAAGVGIGFSDKIDSVNKDIRDSIDTSFDIDPNVRIKNIDANYSGNAVSGVQSSTNEMSLLSSIVYAIKSMDERVVRAINEKDFSFSIDGRQVRKSQYNLNRVLG